MLRASETTQSKDCCISIEWAICSDPLRHESRGCLWKMSAAVVHLSRTHAANVRGAHAAATWGPTWMMGVKMSLSPPATVAHLVAYYPR
jgi:hypothetical protein